MWPFSRKGFDDDHEGHEHRSDRIPVSMLFRWYMYDMDVKNPNKLGKVFNLSPVSEEGDEKERQDGTARIARIKPLVPFLNLYSNMNAQYVYETQRKALLKMPGMTEEILETQADEIQKFYQNLTFAGLLTAFSAAAELELIDLNGTFTGVE